MLDANELAALRDSWLLRLAAERRSPKTRASYHEGIRQFLAWCEAEDRPPALEPNTVAAFTTSVLDRGNAPATARLRQLAVRRFSAWLAAEDEIDRDELASIRPPKLDDQHVDDLTDDQLRALVKACAGKTFIDRRDEAIVRLMAETGARAGEAVAMGTTDVDLSRGLAVIRRGKGGKARTVPFGPLTAATVDRYARMRRRHPRAETPALWLGGHGQGFSYDGLYRALRRRAKDAGIKGFHPHMLRHSAASRWLAAGGSETGLLAVGGWSRMDMLHRYVKGTSETRAAEEARRLGLGDL